MKSILRNLLSVIRRFKMATSLNILGLSIAFAAFMAIMMQIDYDYNFDKFHRDYDHIFRLEHTYNNNMQVIVSRPRAEEFIQSSPHIIAGGIAQGWSLELFFTAEVNGVKNSYKEMSTDVFPSYINMFDFNMYEGDTETLEVSGNILIPLSISRKIFKEESAIGKKLVGQDNNVLTIVGVYHDFPSNSIIQNNIYRSLPKDKHKDDWGSSSYLVYVRVDDPANIESIISNYNKNLKRQSWESEDMYTRLTSLPDIHFVTNVLYDDTPKASHQALRILFAIAIIIILIAGINFTNFSTALTPMRIKSINTQKVLGGDESIIRLSLLIEAVLISLLSFGISLFFIHLIQYTPLVNLLDADPILSQHPFIVGGTALIALCTGILAGLYPSYYMTSFPPALVLKGSFGLSPKGRTLRNGLISIQFIASFALIIGTLFMYLQNHFMQNAPLGYDKDQLIVTDINKKISNSKEAFINQLESFSGIEGATFSFMLLSSQDQYMGWGRNYKDRNIEFQVLPVNYTFLTFMGIDVTEGRNFRKEDELLDEGVFIFNEKAKVDFDLELNTQISGNGEIIGFMPDVKFASFRTEVVPMAFYVWGDKFVNDWDLEPDNFSYIRVKAGSDLRAAMNHVQSTLKTFDPEYAFNVRFFDEVLNKLYEKEQGLTLLITILSLIAIFISMVGVFGLVVFDSQYRKKEIGIRKVLGSTTTQILIMFNKGYVHILAICFILAAPIAWYIINRWLENFAYKTPMHWWVYLLSFILVSALTMLTVTFQNWRAANDNPVNSIKSE